MFSRSFKRFLHSTPVFSFGLQKPLQMKWISISCILLSRQTTQHLMSKSFYSRSTTSQNHDCSEAGTFSLKTSLDKKLMMLDMGNREPARFHAVWLRHNCQCVECKQPYSGQKLIDVSHLQPSYTIASARFGQNHELHVEWNEELHRSVFSLNFLEQNVYSAGDLRQAHSDLEPEPCLSLAELPRMTFEDVLRTDGVLEWMSLVNRFGLCLIQHVPKSDDMVKKMAEMMWPVQHTIYGHLWDVQSYERPINIAYSDAPLGFHMDLVYYESPPGVQFLHCLAFDDCVDGGESLFVDTWHAANSLRSQNPEDFDILAHVPATFQKIHSDRDRPVSMTYRRPHIAVEPASERIVGVFWAPAFEGPLMVPEDLVEPYYKAYQKFARLIENSPTLIEFRLFPGDLISFNNRRMLHARAGFQLNGGRRHLKGCYVNIDEFKSRLEVLAAKSGKNRIGVRHVFNQSWL